MEWKCMLGKINKPYTFIRFGIQRKKDFLRDVRESFDGLVLPANLLLYQYRSTPLAVWMCKHPFFIDPMSYLFGQPYEDFKQRVKKGPRFKPSFSRLMEGHGLDPDYYLKYEYTTLMHSLDKTDKNISEFIDNSLNFQWNNVWDTIQEAAEGLMPSSDRNELKEELYRPAFLIPPYFLYSPSFTAESISTKLNNTILTYCHSQKEKWGDIYPMLFILKDHLNTKFIDDILSIKKYDFPGYCIWIEGFDEREATEEQIRGLVNLVKKLSEGDKRVVMLYGGFFSLILYYFGMTCVCHGLAYGEARKISAYARQDSGPAPIRYYIRELHSFLTLENALVILRKRRDLICDCPICKRVMGDDPEKVTRYEGEEALAEMHFLWNRNEERNMISSSNLEDIISHLDWILSLNDDINEITRLYKGPKGEEERSIIDPNAYVTNWVNVLKMSVSKETIL